MRRDGTPTASGSPTKSARRIWNSPSSYPAMSTTCPPPSPLSDLAIVASIEPEAFGRVATEAQAMGCPVIATDIGAPPETVAAPLSTVRGSDRLAGSAG